MVKKNCNPSDPTDDRNCDTWDHVAIDAESRLVVSVVPGERTTESVVAVVEDFKRRTGGRLMGLITTDGYSSPTATRPMKMRSSGPMARRRRRPGPASEGVPGPHSRSPRRA